MKLATGCNCLLRDDGRLLAPCEAHLRQMLPGGVDHPILDASERVCVTKDEVCAVQR